MAHDLNDAWGWIQKLIRRVSRLESGAMLENSSITGGRMRFIGGLLRVDSGGRVEIVGTLQIDGTTTVTGTFTVDGPWELAGNGTITGNVTGTGRLTWNGPWDLTGTGTITGPVNISGILTLLSDLRVQGGGKITVGPITIDTAGAYGGRIASVSTLLLDATAVLATGPFTASQISSLGGISALGGIAAIGDIESVGEVRSNGLRATGIVNFSGLTGAPVGAVPLMVDGAGRVYKG